MCEVGSTKQCPGWGAGASGGKGSAHPDSAHRGLLPHLSPSSSHPLSPCPSPDFWNPSRLSKQGGGTTTERPGLGSGLLGSLPESATLGQVASYPSSVLKVWRPREQWTWKSRNGLRSWGAPRGRAGMHGATLTGCVPQKARDGGASLLRSHCHHEGPLSRREAPAASTCPEVDGVREETE